MQSSMAQVAGQANTLGTCIARLQGSTITLRKQRQGGTSAGAAAGALSPSDKTLVLQLVLGHVAEQLPELLGGHPLLRGLPDVGEVAAALEDLAGVDKGVEELMVRGLGSKGAGKSAKGLHGACAQHPQRSLAALQEEGEEDGCEDDGDAASEFDDVLTTISDIFSTYKTPVASTTGWGSPRTSCSGGTFAAGGSSIFAGGYHARKDSVGSSSIRRVDFQHVRKDSVGSSSIRRLEDLRGAEPLAPASGPANGATAARGSTLVFPPELAAAAIAAGVLRAEPAGGIVRQDMGAGLGRQQSAQLTAGQSTSQLAVGGQRPSHAAVDQVLVAAAARLEQQKRSAGAAAAGYSSLSALSACKQQPWQQQQQHQQEQVSCSGPTPESTVGDDEFYSVATSTPRTSFDGTSSERSHGAWSANFSPSRPPPSPARPPAKVPLASAASALAPALRTSPAAVSSAAASPARAGCAAGLLDAPLKEVLGDLQHQVQGLKVEELLQQLEAAGVWMPIKLGKS